MRHEDLIQLRKRLDAIYDRAIEVVVAKEHLRYLSGLPGASHEILDWFRTYGFTTAGLREDTKSVWMGLRHHGNWGEGIVVCFHPEARDHAMMFKLAFG